MSLVDRLLPPGPTLWARADLRRRWKSLVVLGLLAGLSSGLALAAVAGARRTDSAFARLRIATNAADAVVFATQVGIIDPDWSKLEAEPYVKKVARWNLLFGQQKDGDGFLLFGPTDGDWMGRVEQPRLLEGRMFSPTAPDEVVIDDGVREQAGIEVGDTIRFQFFNPGDDSFSGAPPSGQTVEFHVVGRIRMPSTLLFTDGQVITSPGLLKTYGANIQALENAYVQVKNPATDMARLRNDVPELVGPAVPVLDLHQVESRVSTAITVERTALLLLALAVAAAGLVFIGQAVTRSVAVVGEDESALRSLGLTAADVSRAAFLPHVLTVAVAVVACVGTALALSPRFPIGFAATVDPDPGFHADWLVVGVGAALTVVVMSLGSLGAAWRQRRRTRPPERSTFVAGLRRVAPVSIGLGTTMALVPGRGRRAIPVRPALVGAVVGVLGLVGTMTLQNGLDEAVTHPERVGVTWDATIEPGSTVLDPNTPGRASTEYVDKVLTSPHVAGVTQVWGSLVDIDGTGVPALAPISLRGDIGFVTLKGRAPRTPDEIAFGPETAADLGIEIGDRITVGNHELSVVGTTLFPEEVHSAFTEGVWMDAATLLDISPTDFAGGSGSYPRFLVKWDPGSNIDEALGMLQEHVADPGATTDLAVIPRELGNLGRVRSVPTALAIFLLLLAVSTLAHALVTTLRLRRADFAVLRALGFTRWMGANVVRTHGTVIALVGLLAGIPIGLAVGRVGWSWVSDQVPLVYAAPFTVGILVVIPAALIIANVVAAWPARRVTRLRSADVLRAE